MPRPIAIIVAAAIAVISSVTGPAAADLHFGLQPEAPSLPSALAFRPDVECELPDQPELRSAWTGTLWPGGIVPYRYDANTDAAMQAAMCEAMDELHTVCNVTFVPRTTQSNFIHILNSTGNSSFVGMVGGGQNVRIYNWNRKYIMAHELMHALGLRHEQSRPDRDTYVQISSSNICQTCCSGNPCNSNFAISPSATTIGPYDFASVMHYGATAFSTNGQPTIICIAPYTQFQTVIGNRNYLSDGDKAGLVARYGAPVDDAFEPNNSLAAAAAITAQTSNLRLTDREDYFRVLLHGGQRTLRVDGWPLAAVEGARLYLYSSAGALIGSEPLAAGDGDGTPFAVLTRNVAGGDHIVRIGRSCGQGGNYTLTLPPACRADINRSGSISVQDIFDFLEAYFAGDLIADFTDSESLSVQDIFDFLAAYFAGCA